jgi:hypothetical protein
VLQHRLEARAHLTEPGIAEPLGFNEHRALLRSRVMLHRLVQGAQPLLEIGAERRQ